jgi:hypothetical protein
MTPPLKWTSTFYATGNGKWMWFVRGPGMRTIADGFTETADEACEAIETLLADLRRGGRLQ